VIALFASGFHGSNLTSTGGFAPYGWGAVLSAIASGGLIYLVAIPHSLLAHGWRGINLGSRHQVDRSGQLHPVHRDRLLVRLA
jgi:hypothetical protein